MHISASVYSDPIATLIVLLLGLFISFMTLVRTIDEHRDGTVRFIGWFDSIVLAIIYAVISAMHIGICYLIVEVLINL